MEEYLKKIENVEHRNKIRRILVWIMETFPCLEYAMKWNQPMFLEHGTFIIGFSVAKGHFSVSPEPRAIEEFSSEISTAGYSRTGNLFRIKWNEPVDYGLLERIIKFNISDKAECTSFWRP